MIRLQEETAKVEKCLLEGRFTEAIVKCFNAPKVGAFDYNLLEPLQKLLRLSSPVAAALARPDMFTGILQKLNHKKAVVRLNLLRIVRSICDPSDEVSDNIGSRGLFDAIHNLAESDNAVLVRNMASELVKYDLEKEQENGSGGRSRAGPMSSRRKSSFTPPSLHQSISAPMTPTHPRISAASAFIDGSVTPRRKAAPLNTGDSILYRPTSRDGSQVVVRKTSGGHSAAASASKSRLPRTSMLRPTRSSMAAPGLRDRDEPPSSLQRESGLRIRDQS